MLWLRLPLPMALDHVNAYALEEPGGGWTLVDTGTDTPDCRQALDALLAGPLGGRDVERVIVTHHHPDHIGQAGRFADRGAEIVTTRTAWLYARMLTLDVQERPDARTLAYWQAAGMDPDLLARRRAQRPSNFADRVAPLPLGFRKIAEGGSLVAGGRRWRISTGDGHAPEHAVLWSEDDDLVLGGDQLLPSISANIGVYASEPEADPLHEWIESCTRLSLIAEERHLVLPGHKLPFTGLPLRLRQMAENHERALVRLEALLAEGPRSACACFPALFRRSIGEDVYTLALVEAVAHLNCLRARGRVRRETDATGVWRWSLT